MTDVSKPSRIHLRGFGSMSPERRREIAASGGAAQLADNRVFRRDPELAREAGRKGGLATQRAIRERAD